MPKSCKILKNKKVISSVIDLFRDGSVLSSKDVSGLLNFPILDLTEDRVNRILVMLRKQGILKNSYDKAIKRYSYSLTDRSVLFSLGV